MFSSLAGSVIFNLVLQTKISAVSEAFCHSRLGPPTARMRSVQRRSLSNIDEPCANSCSQCLRNVFSSTLRTAQTSVCVAPYATIVET